MTELVSVLNGIILVIFDDADITLNRKKMQDFLKQIPLACQVIALSSSPFNKSWIEKLPTGTPMDVSVYGIPSGTMHYFVKCAGDKNSYVISICDEVQSQGGKSIIFCVSFSLLSVIELALLSVILNYFAGQTGYGWTDGLFAASWGKQLSRKSRGWSIGRFGEFSETKLQKQHHHCLKLT